MPRSVDLNDTSLVWSAVRDAFLWDGSLRDIYILQTSVRHWNAILTDLAKREFPLSFFLSDQQQDYIPDSFESIETGAGDRKPLLVVTIDGVRVCTHFFSDEEIEFDLDPSELNEANFLAVCDFLKCLAQATGKAVLITDENWVAFQDRSDPILIVDSDGERAVVRDRNAGLL